MKILYIVPDVNNEGGVARVLSIKANYLIEKFGYDISILTQNKGNSSTFYEFNKKIEFHDMILKGNIFKNFKSYRKNINQKIKEINPGVILICDNGLKAYIVPFITKTKTPIILECHGSRFVEDFEKNNTFFEKIFSKIKYKFKKFCASKFYKIICLSNESLTEWNPKNAIIIPNPVWFKTNSVSKLQNKKAIIIARHSFEKGLDRILPIWKKVIRKHNDWQLDIYGKSSKKRETEKLILILNLEKNVTLFEPVKEIQEKYLDASMYLMTSRHEGFPMVLIEAMAFGLPCIAYDCPVGPRAIINNNENGFLIENENETDFINAIKNLIENENLRIEMGKNAKKSSEKYNLDLIMKSWNTLFLEIVN
jgi:glycosyltransferase involved in cell wall biosynthesis